MHRLDREALWGWMRWVAVVVRGFGVITAADGGGRGGLVGAWEGVIAGAAMERSGCMGFVVVRLRVGVDGKGFRLNQGKFGPFVNFFSLHLLNQDIMEFCNF